MKSDDFGCQCRATTKSGKQCSRRAHTLVNITTRRSWLAAIRTGWPMCLPGMVKPVTHKVGLCMSHWAAYERSQRNDEPFKIRDTALGSPKKPGIDRAYERARKMADQKLEEWRKDIKSITPSLKGGACGLN